MNYIRETKMPLDDLAHGLATQSTTTELTELTWAVRGLYSYKDVGTVGVRIGLPAGLLFDTYGRSLADQKDFVFKNLDHGELKYRLGVILRLKEMTSGAFVQDPSTPIPCCWLAYLARIDSVISDVCKRVLDAAEATGNRLLTDAERGNAH